MCIRTSFGILAVTLLVSDRARKGRHLAASIASGIYWRLGEHCFKQEIRADGLSVFFFYSDEEWWVTTSPVAPGFDSSWHARACPPVDTPHTRLDLLEWHRPV